MTHVAIDQVISKALTQVLRLFNIVRFNSDAVSADVPKIVYTYSSDFPLLWSSTGWRSGCPIVVLWDNSERLDAIATVNVNSHISPLAWATCALKAHRHLEVVILDLSPERHRQVGGLYRLIETIQSNQMPWLRLVSLNTFGQFLLESRFLVTAVSPPSSNEVQRDEILEILSEQVRKELTKETGERDRHAIQNLVGPMVLLGRDHLESRGVAERALLHVFEATELIPKELSGSYSPIQLVKEDLWGNQPLRLLLLDDQADYGWADWVRSNLPISKPNLVILDVLTRPEMLLDQLVAEMRLSKNGMDRRFELDLSDGTVPVNVEPTPDTRRQTILLLDLRLHSTRSAESEAAFFQELLPLCERFRTDGPVAKFAWPGFSPQELQAVERWCSAPSRNHPDHFVVLTLLPRLLALVDMSLPIVIFSSTGKREITERLKPYGNIITEFEKPRFLGLSAPDVARETTAKLERAITRALSLLAARRKCGLILSAPIRPHIEIPVGHKGYLELFLDETEKSKQIQAGKTTKEIREEITVGGCFAFYVDPTDARSKADRFDDELVKCGARYFHNRGIGPSPLGGKLLTKKYEGLADVLTQCDKTFSPTVLGLLRLTLPLTGAQSKPRLLDPLEADNGFRQCLKTAIELFLAETMFALLGQAAGNVKVSVYAGTRVFELEKRSDQKRAQSDYGMGQHPSDPQMFYSLGRSELFPLVADAIQQHGFQRSTARIIAVKMAYAGSHAPEAEWFLCLKCKTPVYHTTRDEDKGRKLRDALVCDCSSQGQTLDFRPDYRALHYLADDILSNFPVGNRSLGRYDELFKASQVAGEFDEVLDSELEMSLAASRALDQGDILTAVEKLQPVVSVVAGSKPKARYWITQRIKSHLGELGGEAFMRLAGSLAEQIKTAKRNQSPTL